MRIYNRTENLDTRRNLRHNAPPAEVILWQKLRGSQIASAKFRRPYSVGRFVLDFYCAEVKLGIELDGASHEDEAAQSYDRARQAEIEALGITVLRFTNEQVYGQLGVVVENIALRVDELRKSKHFG